MKWENIKQDGSGHYKNRNVEPIDLYKEGDMLVSFALCSIIKYAFRSRPELHRADKLTLSDMDKTIHYANMVKCISEERIEQLPIHTLEP